MASRKPFAPSGEDVARYEQAMAYLQANPLDRRAFVKAGISPDRFYRVNAAKAGQAGKGPDMSRLRGTKWYASLRRDFARQHNLSEAKAEKSPLFRAALVLLYSPDASASGPQAQALIIVGRREPEWDYLVGDTPTEAAA